MKIFRERRPSKDSFRTSGGVGSKVTGWRTQGGTKLLNPEVSSPMVELAKRVVLVGNRVESWCYKIHSELTEH